MLKCLLMFVLLTAQNPVPGDGGKQQEHTQSHNEQTNQKPPTVLASEIDKENAANAERYAYYKAHPKEYFKAAFAPANFSNWILAGLGIVASGIGLTTIGAIKRQADLQRANMRQWVEVEVIDTEIKESPYEGVGAQFKSLASVMITFRAINRTPLPFTITKIVTKVRKTDEGEYGIWEVSTVNEKMIVHPYKTEDSGTYPFYVITKLVGENAVRDFARNNFMFTIDGKVTFSSAAGDEEVQNFHFLIRCGTISHKILPSLGRTPLTGTEDT